MQGARDGGYLLKIAEDLFVAVDMGFLSEEAALKALGAEVGIDFVDLPDAQVDTAVLANFPQKLIYRQNMFPLRRENGSLIVATSDPFDLYPLDEISAATGLTVIPVLASRGVQEVPAALTVLPTILAEIARALKQFILSPLHSPGL